MKAKAPLAILAAIALSSAASATQPNIPPNYTVTPFGYFHASCHIVAARGDNILVDKRRIRHADGTLSQIRPCAYPHFRADGTKTAASDPPTIGHSWLVWAVTDPPARNPEREFGGISAEWTVPANPVSSDGQTLYFFPGLAGALSIVQPVLGWNAGFPNAWGISSWNCCVAGTVVEAGARPVSPGDTIYGEVSNNCAAGAASCPTWNIYTLDLRTGESSELAGTSSSGQTFIYAYGGAVEVYNVIQCTDFPPEGELAMSNIKLFDPGLKQMQHPNWTIVSTPSLTPDCSYTGKSAKQVILAY